MSDSVSKSHPEVMEPEGFSDLSIIGWVIVKKNGKEPLKTNAYPRTTAKCYSSAGKAKAAFANSKYKRHHALYMIVPVYFPSW